MALPHRRVRGDSDHDVREVAARRLAHPQAPQLDRRIDRNDGEPRGLLCVRRSTVHEDIRVAAHQAAGRDEDEGGDEERGHGISLRVAVPREQEPDEDGARAGEIAAEVERVRGESRAVVTPGGTGRGDRPRHVDSDHDHDDEQRPPRHVDSGRVTRHKALNRAHGDVEARRDEEGRLCQSGEMLGLPVPVLVTRIGGPHGDTDREEREERRDEVGAGMDRFRDETETVRCKARPELERDERAGGEDGHQCGPALRAHRRKPRSVARAAR